MWPFSPSEPVDPILLATIQAANDSSHPAIAPTPGPVNAKLQIMVLPLAVDVSFIFEEVCISFSSYLD